MGLSMFLFLSICSPAPDCVFVCVCMRVYSCFYPRHISVCIYALFMYLPPTPCLPTQDCDFVPGYESWEKTDPKVGSLRVCVCMCVSV